MTESTAPITVAGVSTGSAVGAMVAGQSSDRRKPSIDGIIARRARVTVVTVVAVVAVGVLLGVAGWQVTQLAHVRRIEQAQASCTAALQGLDAMETRLDRALAQARRMAGVDANSVADPATLRRLRTLLDRSDTGMAHHTACAGDMAALDRLTARTRAHSRTAAGRTSALEQAVQAVDASQRRKSLDQARTTLRQAIASAASLLADANGRVADQATRTRLAAALATARQGQAGTDAQRLNALADALAQAGTRVRASMDAKRRADAQAADARHAASGSSAGMASGGTAKRATGSTHAGEAGSGTRTASPTQQNDSQSADDTGGWQVPTPTGANPLPDRL
jgi:hypothetical protein